MSDLYVPDPEDLRLCRGNWLFADGGVIWDGNGIASRSEIGGTWAWCAVADGEQIASGSGVLTPSQIGMDTVTNNVTELYAMAKGLQSRPNWWHGVVCSDSWCTLCRRFPSAGMEGIPDPLQHFARVQFERFLSTCWWTLLDGHPTKKHFADGFGKRGQPVSEWNAWCDKECNRLAKPLKVTAKPATAEVLEDMK